jgi:crotonobetainyl-CoA:carnitine CoA-transferase CaiB-like acyl-CoA transferase
MPDPDPTTKLPLSNVTVVELGNLIAGPFTGLMLGDLGADVIKIERPGTGDMIRQSGDSGEAIFTAFNRNKRSVKIDLQSDAGRAAYRELVSEADIVIENLRPGVVDRLGIGYDALTEDRDDLIYVSIAGFLQGGTYEDRPGMDVVGQAMSGMMRMTGHEDEKPLRAGTSVVDIGTGVYGAFGAMTALWMRETTGRGQKVDAGLFETASHWTNYWTIFAQLFGDHPPLGSSHPAFGLYDVFETDPDEWLFVGVITERQWPAFCEAIDRPDLEDDDRFATNSDRVDNMNELEAIISETLQERTTDEWMSRIVEDAGVPAGPVFDVEDALYNEQTEARDVMTTLEHPEHGEVPVIEHPLQYENADSGFEAPAPKLGEHNRNVFDEIGYTEDEIEALEEQGAFGDQ